MTYTRESDLIISEKFLVSRTTIIHATINVKDLIYRIWDQDGNILITGQASSLRQAKVNVKVRLIQLGVKFYDEIRNSTAE